MNKNCKINYSTIITKDELENLTSTEWNYITSEAEKQSNILRKINYSKNPSPLFTTRATIEGTATETVFLKDYKNFNPTIKNMLATEITYNDSEMLINILLSKGIDYNILNRTMNSLPKLKQMSLLKDENELDETTIENKNMNALCKLINTYYANKNYNFIINKLVEIVTFEQDLYLELQGEKQKTR